MTPVAIVFLCQGAMGRLEQGLGTSPALSSPLRLSEPRGFASWGTEGAAGALGVKQFRSRLPVRPRTRVSITEKPQPLSLPRGQEVQGKGNW